MVDRKTLEIEKAEPVALTGEELAARKTSLRALRALIITRGNLSLKMDYEKQRLEEKEEEKKHYTARPRDAARKDGKIRLFCRHPPGGCDLHAFCGAGVGRVAPALAVCLVLAGILGWLLYGLALKASSARAAATQSRLAELDAQIRAAASVLDEAGSSGSGVDRKIEELTRASAMCAQPTLEDLDLREAAVDEELRRCERIVRLAEDQKTWSGRAEKAMKALEEGRKKKEAEETALQSAGKEWEAYLRGSRLASGMTPRTVYQVFTMVENIRSRLRTLSDKEERIRRMEEHQREYLSVAAKMRSFSGLSDADPAHVLPLLDARLRRDREIAARLHEREKAEARLKDRADRVRVVQKARDEAKAIADKAVEDEEEGVAAVARLALGRGV